MSEHIFKILLLKSDDEMIVANIITDIDDEIRNIISSDKDNNNDIINAISYLLRDSPLKDVKYIMASIIDPHTNRVYVGVHADCLDIVTVDRLTISGKSLSTSLANLIYIKTDVLIHGDLLRRLLPTEDASESEVSGVNANLSAYRVGDILAKLFNCNLSCNLSNSPVIIGFSNDDAPV